MPLPLPQPVSYPPVRFFRPASPATRSPPAHIHPPKPTSKSHLLLLCMHFGAMHFRHPKTPFSPSMRAFWSHAFSPPKSTQKCHLLLLYVHFGASHFCRPNFKPNFKPKAFKILIDRIEHLINLIKVKT